MGGKKNKADYILFIAVIALVIFGLVMIASVGVPQSLRVSTKSLNTLFPSCEDSGADCYFYLKRHSMYLGLGLIALFMSAKIPHRWWKRLSIVLFGTSIAILFGLRLFGVTHGTFARSWINIGFFSFQPIEFAKIGLIFYLGHWLDQKGANIASFQNGFLPFCIITSLILIPVVLQPDLGGALVIGIIAVAMLFSAGAKFRHLALGALVGVILLFVVNAVYPILGNRVQAFLMGYEEACTLDECTQPLQANIAVGSGGFWGKGLTQGVQKSGWLPQATDDFMFAASGEEMGFLRMFLVIFAYALIAYRGYKIALGANTRFGMYTATGITTWIIIQTFVHMAVNLALMPTTGITLPLVSYGGSSLIATLSAVGILLNISKSSSYDTSSLLGRGNRRAYSAQRSSYSRPA